MKIFSLPFGHDFCIVFRCWQQLNDWMDRNTFEIRPRTGTYPHSDVVITFLNCVVQNVIDSSTPCSGKWMINKWPIFVIYCLTSIGFVRNAKYYLKKPNTWSGQVIWSLIILIDTDSIQSLLLYVHYDDDVNNDNPVFERFDVNIWISVTHTEKEKVVCTNHGNSWCMEPHFNIIYFFYLILFLMYENWKDVRKKQIPTRHTTTWRIMCNAD